MCWLFGEKGELCLVNVGWLREGERRVTSIFLYDCESWTLTAELQKKNTSYGNELLPQDTTHLIKRLCYERESLCQTPAGNRTTRRSPDDRTEMQTAVVWTCLPLIRSCQNNLARHSEKQRKMEETGHLWRPNDPRGNG